MNLGLSQRLGLQMKQSPQQVLLSSLLQLPLVSLEQRIKIELEQNPFLEEELEMEETLEQEMELKEKTEEEEYDSSVDGEEYEGDIAEGEKGEDDREVDWDTILNDENNYDYRPPKDNSAEVFERPDAVETALPDHLLSQLHMTKLSDIEMAIGEEIIWNIGEDGYLKADVDDIAENYNVSEDTVEKVLNSIQRFDPVGIGARNLQECLLIQLLEMEKPPELAVVILRDHFDDFKNKRFEKITKKLGITLDDFKKALDEITKLNPKPGEGYIEINQNYIIPDITVEKDNGDYKILLNDWNVPHLRINHSYKKLLLDKKNTSKETKDYIKQRLESARWLINSIHQRRLTILKVVEAILDRQRDFFDKGKNFIKPMILKDIADEIGMDISTVSRVTNGKYVQTDYGVFELKYFFSEKIKRDNGEDVSNKKVRNKIKEIISKEDPQKPYNDQKIADILKSEGFNVARRTVAKYREQMMIPVSRLRRRIV
ncbi:RNA polymerase factor sigma-54 [candidate division KSB1 bacterium]|nr:RNA polymerase factor sigma-54 [candidate division KSB1 bacterium]